MVCLIVMQNKCARYWPSKDRETGCYGKIMVRLVDEKTTVDFTLREFEVCFKYDDCGAVQLDGGRKVYQYHFTAWPDHGVPSDPGCVLNFLNEVNKRQESMENAGPVIVHCR